MSTGQHRGPLGGGGADPGEMDSRADALTTGPICVASSVGSPTTSARARSASAPRNRSAIRP